MVPPAPAAIFAILTYVHARTDTRAYAHRIGVYLVAERAVGGFFLLHPAEEDVRDSSVGLFATDLAKAAR